MMQNCNSENNIIEEKYIVPDKLDTIIINEDKYIVPHKLDSFTLNVKQEMDTNVTADNAIYFSEEKLDSNSDDNSLNKQYNKETNCNSTDNNKHLTSVKLKDYNDITIKQEEIVQVYPDNVVSEPDLNTLSCQRQDTGHPLNEGTCIQSNCNGITSEGCRLQVGDIKKSSPCKSQTPPIKLLKDNKCHFSYLVDGGSSIHEPQGSSSKSSINEIGKGNKLHPIFDGKYFKVLFQDGNKLKCLCTACNQELSALTNVSTNLYTHLKRRHANLVKTVQQYAAGARKRKKHAENGPFESEPKHYKSSSQSTIQQCCSPEVQEIKQKDVDNCISNFIVQGNHPLSTVEQPAFVKLISTLNPSVTVISRRTLSRKLVREEKDMKDILKTIIDKQLHICLTADVRSTRHRSFLRVTVHWIDKDSFARHKGVLACRRFKGKHNYTNIAEKMKDIIQEYNINTDKISATVTDNSSNFVKAFKEFGVVINSLTTNEDDDGEETEQGYPNNEDQEDSNLEMEIRHYEEDTEPSFHLSKHVHCASHTLSLVATTDAKHALKFSIFSTINHSTMEKCTALWNKGGRLKSAETIRKILDCSLPLPCVTRWNSLLDSIATLLDHKGKLHTVMSALQLPTFKNSELEFLQEYYEILSPIAIAINRLQGEDAIYYGELLPTLLTVDKNLTELKSKNYKYCQPLVHAVNQGFEKRFGNFVSLNNEPLVKDAILASVTHPYFKLRFINIKNTWNVEEKQHLIKTLLTNAANTSEVCQIVDPPSLSDGDDYFGFSKVNFSSSHLSNIDLQLLAYLNDGDYKLESLTKHPLIRKLFIKYNTTLPSSVPVERLFSFAGITLSPKRNSLSDTSFERLVLLKCNGDLIPK